MIESLYVNAVNHATTGLRRLIDALLEAVTHTETTLSEFVCSTTFLWVGVVMLLEPGALIPTSRLYASMTALMPQEGWGVLFILVGLFQSVANLRSLRRAETFMQRNETMRMRRIAAATAALLFGYIGALGIHQHPVSIFGALCKAQALGQLIAFWHLGYHIEREARSEG